jgi:diguanylate cyclase (GGDEF)-like protein
MEIGESINPDLLDADDALRKKLFEDLAATPAVDFAARARVGSPDHKPVARQVRRYIEARFRQNVSRVPQLAHVVFFDVFRGIANLYCYLLNDRKSFAAQTSHVVTAAGEGEREHWSKEREDRGRESLLRLQDRLTEDYPGRFEDGLTGLKNKEYFISELPPWAEKLRAAGKPLALLMIDIDHFKWVNDELGHQAGDEVLKETAGMILDNIREGDIAIRYGGEEILVAVCSDLHTGIILAERLRFLQQQNVQVHGSFIGVKLISEQRKEPCGTLSIGVADAAGTPDLGEGVRRADKALYEAKRARNQVVLRDPEKKGEEPFTTYADYRRASESG